MTQSVLILGASGKIGRAATAAFAKAGWDVRKYDRKAGNMIGQAKGADIIVNGLNPKNYHNWAQNIPRITREVIAAAKASGATVILPGNVYNFGDTEGVWDEHTPHRPTARKGVIRETAEQAYKASGVQTIVLRGGDFIDPTDGSDDIMQLVLLRGIRKGKLTLPGAPSNMHAYCYLPDWGKAAVLLAEKRSALDQFEDIPFGGYDFSLNELKDTLEKAMSKPLKTQLFPWWLMRALSPFIEVARELLEMRYLWDTPHSLGTAKLDRLLPDFERTDLTTIIQASLPRDVYPDQSVAKQALVTAR